MSNPFLIQALAELAYSIALADGELQEEEKNAFYEIIDTELRQDASWAKDRFKLLEEKVNPSIEQCYKFAMFAIKTNRNFFDDTLKMKFLNVITRVADSVNGLEPSEVELIERFKKDIRNL